MSYLVIIKNEEVMMQVFTGNNEIVVNSELISGETVQDAAKTILAGEVEEPVTGDQETLLRLIEQHEDWIGFVKAADFTVTEIINNVNEATDHLIVLATDAMQSGIDAIIEVRTTDTQNEIGMINTDGKPQSFTTTDFTDSIGIIGKSLDSMRVSGTTYVLLERMSRAVELGNDWIEAITDEDTIVVKVI